MTESSLVLVRDTHPLLLLSSGSKDAESRLQQFVAWQHEREPWWQPDLAAYRDDLLADGLSPASVSAYLGTVRGAYRKLLVSNMVRDQLYSMMDPELSAADRRAYVAEIIDRLSNAVHPSASPVKQVKVQDEEDNKHLRLTIDQAQQLLAAPDTRTLLGLRDAAVIAVLLCTGIREDELCNLDVDDLRREFGEEVSLLVRHGKGDKQRLVPYGDLVWCLDLVDAWMWSARIAEGPVFRGLARGNAVRKGRLTTRSVQRILEKYPVWIGGQWVHVRPHDCRRTYARLMYESGMDLLALQQNMGHTDAATTKGYIGTLDASARRARGILHYNEVSAVNEGCE